MAIWISWNIDISRSLNSCDSFLRRKFKNQALKSCRPRLTLSTSTISFELVEEIDLENCNFQNFRSSVTLTLTLHRVEVALVRISGRGLATYQIRSKSEKLFVDVWMDGCTDWQLDTPELQSIFKKQKCNKFRQVSCPNSATSPLVVNPAAAEASSTAHQLEPTSQLQGCRDADAPPQMAVQRLVYLRSDEKWRVSHDPSPTFTHYKS